MTDKLADALEAVDSAIKSHKEGELCGWELHLIKRRIQALTAHEAAKAATPDDVLDAVTQVINEARCLSKEVVGNRELAQRVLNVIHTPNTPDDVREAVDAAYKERNQVVAALAKAFPSGIKKTAIEGWDEAWHNCVYIDLPTGQASWHYHDRDAYLFEGLPHYAGTWDGHTTPEKYDRLHALRQGVTLPREVVDAVTKTLNNAWKLVDCDTRHSNREIAAYAERICKELKDAAALLDQHARGG